MEIDKENLGKRDLSTLRLLLEVENKKTTPEEVIVKVSDGGYRIQMREMAFMEDRHEDEHLNVLEEVEMLYEETMRAGGIIGGTHAAERTPGDGMGRKK